MRRTPQRRSTASSTSQSSSQSSRGGGGRTKSFLNESQQAEVMLRMAAAAPDEARPPSVSVGAAGDRPPPALALAALPSAAAAAARFRDNGVSGGSAASMAYRSDWLRTAPCSASLGSSSTAAAGTAAADEVSWRSIAASLGRSMSSGGKVGGGVSGDDRRSEPAMTTATVVTSSAARASSPGLIEEDAPCPEVPRAFLASSQLSGGREAGAASGTDDENRGIRQDHQRYHGGWTYPRHPAMDGGSNGGDAARSGYGNADSNGGADVDSPRLLGGGGCLSSVEPYEKMPRIPAPSSSRAATGGDGSASRLDLRADFSLLPFTAGQSPNGWEEAPGVRSVRAVSASSLPRPAECHGGVADTPPGPLPSFPRYTSSSSQAGQQHHHQYHHSRHPHSHHFQQQHYRLPQQQPGGHVPYGGASGGFHAAPDEISRASSKEQRRVEEELLFHVPALGPTPRPSSSSSMDVGAGAGAGTGIGAATAAGGRDDPPPRQGPAEQRSRSLHSDPRHPSTRQEEQAPAHSGAGAGAHRLSRARFGLASLGTSATDLADSSDDSDSDEDDVDSVDDRIGTAMAAAAAAAAGLRPPNAAVLEHPEWARWRAVSATDHERGPSQPPPPPGAGPGVPRRGRHSTMASLCGETAASSSLVAENTPLTSSKTVATTPQASRVPSYFGGGPAGIRDRWGGRGGQGKEEEAKTSYGGEDDVTPQSPMPREASMVAPTRRTSDVREHIIMENEQSSVSSASLPGGIRRLSSLSNRGSGQHIADFDLVHATSLSSYGSLGAASHSVASHPSAAAAAPLLSSNPTLSSQPPTSRSATLSSFEFLYGGGAEVEGARREELAATATTRSEVSPANVSGGEDVTGKLARFIAASSDAAAAVGDGFLRKSTLREGVPRQDEGEGVHGDILTQVDDLLGETVMDDERLAGFAEGFRKSLPQNSIHSEPAQRHHQQGHFPHYRQSSTGDAAPHGLDRINEYGRTATIEEEDTKQNVLDDELGRILSGSLAHKYHHHDVQPSWEQHRRSLTAASSSHDAAPARQLRPRMSSPQVLQLPSMAAQTPLLHNDGVSQDWHTERDDSALRPPCQQKSDSPAAAQPMADPGHRLAPPMGALGHESGVKAPSGAAPLSGTCNSSFSEEEYESSAYASTVVVGNHPHFSKLGEARKLPPGGADTGYAQQVSGDISKEEEDSKPSGAMASSAAASSAGGRGRGHGRDCGVSLASYGDYEGSKQHHYNDHGIDDWIARDPSPHFSSATSEDEKEEVVRRHEKEHHRPGTEKNNGPLHAARAAAGGQLRTSDPSASSIAASSLSGFGLDSSAMYSLRGSLSDEEVVYSLQRRANEEQEAKDRAMAERLFSELQMSDHMQERRDSELARTMCHEEEQEAEAQKERERRDEELAQKLEREVQQQEERERKERERQDEEVAKKMSDPELEKIKRLEQEKYDEQVAVAMFEDDLHHDKDEEEQEQILKDFKLAQKLGSSRVVRSSDDCGDETSQREQHGSEDAGLREEGNEEVAFEIHSSAEDMEQVLRDEEVARTMDYRERVGQETQDEQVARMVQCLSLDRSPPSLPHIDLPVGRLDGSPASPATPLPASNGPDHRAHDGPGRDTSSAPGMPTQLRRLISRCPERILKAGDTELSLSDSWGLASQSGGGPGSDVSSQNETRGSITGRHRRCAVCLSPYKEGDHVRTIPCFHSFHTTCVDRWLSQKAECPVCKHPAFG